MRGTPRLLLGLALLLSGCTVIRIDHEKLPEPEGIDLGEIRFMALRGENPDRLANGYVMSVTRNFAVVGTYESSSSQAISSPALEPGIYDISITGRKIEPQSAQVEVRAGQS